MPLAGKTLMDQSTQLKRLVYVGVFNPPFLAFARSCHARGVQVYLLEIGPHQFYLSASVAGYRSLDASLLYCSEGICAIRNYVTQVKAQALIALSEQHILWLSRERIAFDGTAKVLLPPYETLDFLKSKQAQANLARKVGLNVLPTHVFRAPEDAAQVPATHYPLCLRPSAEDAVDPMFKVEIVNSPDELLRQLASCRIIDSILGQPFQSLPTLVVHGISSEDGKPQHLVAFLADRKFEGVTLRLRKTELQPEIGRSLMEFSRLAGLTGAYHFDLLYDPEHAQSYFLEVNPRLGGTTDKVIWLGYDEPALCVESYGYRLGSLHHRFNSVHSRVANKRALLKHMVCALRGSLQTFDYPPVSRYRNLLNSAVDLVLARDSNFDRHDLAGSLSMHFRRPSGRL